MSAASQRGACVALLAAVVVVGGWLRFDAADDQYGELEIAGGDVATYYIGTAVSYLEGRGWTPNLDYNYIPPPLQSVFMVAVWKAWPEATPGDLRRLQAVVSTLTIVLAFGIGCALGGRWTGAAFATLIALDPDLIDYVGVLLTETHYFALLFGFVGLLVWGLKRNQLGLVAASGVLLGLTSLTKSFPMLLAIVVPAWIVGRSRSRESALLAAAFFAAFVLTVSPWLVRNAVRYGHLYPISTNSGTLLAQSNFASLEPLDAGMIFWNDIYKTDVWKSVEIEQRFAGATDAYGKLEWNQKDRAYGRHALGYALSHPFHFARNFAIKLYNALVYPLPAGNANPVAVAPSSASYVYRAVTILLGLLGLVALSIGRQRLETRALCLVTAYFLVFTALFHITKSGRINLPLKVLLAMIAAHWAVDTIGRHLAATRDDETDLGGAADQTAEPERAT